MADDFKSLTDAPAFDPSKEFSDAPPFDPSKGFQEAQTAPKTRMDYLTSAVQPWKHVAKSFMEGARSTAAAVNPWDPEEVKSRDQYLKGLSEGDFSPSNLLGAAGQTPPGRGLRAAWGVGSAALSPVTGAMESIKDVGNAIYPPPSPQKKAEFEKAGIPAPVGGGDILDYALMAMSPQRWGATWRSVGRRPSALDPALPPAPKTTVDRPSDVIRSEGQATGSLPLIQKEQGAYQGAAGPRTKARAEAFFEGQQRPQIAEANESVFNAAREGGVGAANPREATESIVDVLTQHHEGRTQNLSGLAQTLDRTHEVLRERLSPTGTVLARTPDEAAQIVSQSVGAADDAARAATNAAYRQFEALPGTFHPASFNNAASELRFRIASPENLERRLSINPEATPTANRVFDELPEIIKGITQRRDPETGRIVGGEVPLTPQRVELVRQWLNSELGTAMSLRDKPKDAQAMRRVIDEFDALVARKLRTTFTGGDPTDVVNAIERARALYREHHQDFYSRGSGDKIGPIIQQIIGRHEGQALTPEQLGNTLYEGSNSVALARRLLEIFGNTPEVRGALKQGLFSHITEAPPGKAPYTPAQIEQRIERFTRGTGRSLTETYLDNPREIEALRLLGRGQGAYGQMQGARINPIDAKLRRMTGADGNPRASIEDSMGELFGSVLRNGEYAPEMVRRLTQGPDALLSPAQQSTFREGLLRYALTAANKGDEPLNYKKIADNLHQLYAGEAGRAAFSGPQRELIGELRDLYRVLPVPQGGRQWSNNATFLTPILTSISERVLQAIATAAAHKFVGHIPLAPEAIGAGAAKLLSRNADVRAMKDVSKQLPLISEELTKYQRAVNANNKRNNALTRRQLEGATVSLTNAAKQIGVDLPKLPAIQSPGAIRAEDEEAPGRAEGGGVNDPFVEPSFPEQQQQQPGYLSQAVEFVGKALPPIISQGLQPLWDGRARAAFMEGVSKSGHGGLKSYAEAVENQYVPEGAVASNDAGEWLDKEGKVLPNQRRPNILPITRAAEKPERLESSGGSGWGGEEHPRETGWLNTGLEGAMPAMLDVWNTFGAPAKATSAVVAAAKAGSEGKLATQAAQALREGQDVYHGTRTPTFERFRVGSEDGNFSTIDRELGVHVAKDPRISDTFISSDIAPSKGGMYPLRIPEDSKFLEVPQGTAKGSWKVTGTEGVEYFPNKAAAQAAIDANPVLKERGVEPKRTPHHELEFDSSAVERLVMEHVYKKDPEMLARYLEQARRVPPKEAKEAAEYLSQGYMADWGEGAYNLSNFIRNFAGRPYNKADQVAAVDMFRKDMQAQGYEGLKYINTAPDETRNAKDATSYIVFDPHKTIQNRLTGAFMSDSGAEGRAATQLAQSLRPENASFYSAAERAIEGAKQNKATPEQWYNWLRNQPGVTKDELEHLGLEDWAKPRPGANRVEPVSKEDLLKHAQERGLGLKEEVRVGALDERTITKVVDDQTVWWVSQQEQMFGRPPDEQAIRQYREDIRTNVEDYPEDYGLAAPATRHHQWVMPGGENYREIISTLPVQGPKPKLSVEEHAELLQLLNRDDRLQARGEELAPTELRRLKELQMRAGKPKDVADLPKPYRHSHWPGVENPLYHMRVNDREIPISAEATAAYKKAVDNVEGLVNQQHAIANTIRKASEYLYASRDAQIRQAVREGQLTPAEAVRKIEEPIEPDSVMKQLQDRLERVRGEEAEARKRIPAEKPFLNTLHLEELQSDWHQQGRKYGYRNPEKEAEALKALTIGTEELRPFLDTVKNRWKTPTGEPLQPLDLHRMLQENSPDTLFPADLFPTAPREALWKYYDAAQEFRKQKLANIPDAPFKKNWAELGLRNALIKAVQEGKDAISWTPGVEQAKRYDLSKHVRELLVQRGSDGNFTIIGKRNADESGFGTTLAHNVAPDKLPDYIGKDLASKIDTDFKEFGDVGPAATKTYSGVDLHIGGEGMKAFYDKMLVNKMNDLGKKYGAKVEWKSLQGAKWVPSADEIFEVRRGFINNERGVHAIDSMGGQLRDGWYHLDRDGETPVGPFRSHDTLLKEIDATTASIPVFKIPEKMRQDIIQKGLPLFSDSGTEGRAASQAAQAMRDSEYGRGWFYNPKNNSLHKIDSEDLGPHGDHDGWISIGENAKKLGIDEKEAAAFQTATWGPRLDTANPYVKELIEQLPAEAKKNEDTLYEWFDEHRGTPAFEKLFQKVFGTDSNFAAGTTPELVRIRRWPGRKGDADFLSITEAGAIQGSPKKFVSQFMKDNPLALDGVGKVGIEYNGNFIRLTPEQFLSGRWSNKDAEFRADSGGEGRAATQVAQARRELTEGERKLLRLAQKDLDQGSPLREVAEDYGVKRKPNGELEIVRDRNGLSLADRDVLTEWVEESTNHLRNSKEFNTTLQRMPTYKGPVWRSTTLPISVANKLLESKGKTFTMDRHSSSSRSQKIAKGFIDTGSMDGDEIPVLFQIISRTGRRIPFGGEEEVILPKGMKLKLDKIEYKKGTGSGYNAAYLFVKAREAK